MRFYKKRPQLIEYPFYRFMELSKKYSVPAINWGMSFGIFLTKLEIPGAHENLTLQIGLEKICPLL
jgi:hypothetical protein